MLLGCYFCWSFDMTVRSPWHGFLSNRVLKEQRLFASTEKSVLIHLVRLGSHFKL